MINNEEQLQDVSGSKSGGFYSITLSSFINLYVKNINESEDSNFSINFFEVPDTIASETP